MVKTGWRGTQVDRGEPGHHLQPPAQAGEGMSGCGSVVALLSRLGASLSWPRSPAQAAPRT